MHESGEKPNLFYIFITIFYQKSEVGGEPSQKNSYFPK
jgi:hypothetical protein